MNPHDKNNLDFLMNVSAKTLSEWADQASDDDILYALELVRQAQAELAAELIEVLDEVEDCTEAKSVLKKFMLNK